MTAYTLERVTPAGDTRTQGPFRTAWAACQAAAYVLTDNGATRDRKAAGAAAIKLLNVKLGEPLEAFGYTFRVEVSR